jgi:endo-1,4-beta-xylanase
LERAAALRPAAARRPEEAPSGGIANGDTSGNGNGDGNGDARVAELDFDHLHALADFPIGVAVSGPGEARNILRTDDRGDAERSVVEQHFSQLTAANVMKMSYLHNIWGTYTYGDADSLLNFAAENGMNVHGHALLWHSCYQVPHWVGQSAPGPEHGGSSAVFLNMLATHVSTIAGRYAGSIPSWDVVNEAFLDNGEYRQGTSDCWSDGNAPVFYEHAGGPVYIETAFEAARAGDASAHLYYNDFNLTPNGPKMAAVLAMIDDFTARQIPIDGIGFQMHVHLTWPDVSDMRDAFQSVVDRGLMVKITELDVLVNNFWSGDYPTYDSFTEAAAEAQRIRYCEIATAYLEVVPSQLRGGITVWGLVDSDSWLIDLYNGDESWPLLFNDDLTPKPALIGLADGLRGRDCH